MKKLVMRLCDKKPSGPLTRLSNILLRAMVLQLAPFTSHVSPSDVAEIWDHLTSGYAVVASQASRVVCALATSAMMLPALHPLQQLGISPAEVSAWVELAEQLFWQSHRESQIIGDRRFGSVKTYQDFSDNLKSLCMFTVLYTYSGQVDSLWDTIGHGVRRGSACGLFDRRHVSWQMLDDMEREQRIAMAKHLLVLDRWQAFVCARPFAIHPLQVHLTTARDGDPDNCPMSLQLRLTEAAYEFSDTIDAYPPSERHRRALDIEAVLEHGMRRGLVRYCSDGGTAIMSERGSLFPYIHAFAHSQRPVRMFELVWLSSFAFLRCMVTRRFLTDESVPASLRYRSLDHAKCVLATAPAISRILREGTAPLNVTLNGNHFLCALTAYIAAAAGGRDTYPESLGRALGEHPHELRTLASNHAHALSRITLGPEVGAARASDWRMERRLPPLLPAGMMPSSAPADGGVHVRPDLASSRGQSPSSSGVTVQGEHTYQQRDPSPLCQTRLPALEHRRPTEHIQWLRQNMSTVVECFKLLEERGSTKAERCQALLRLLLDIATSLGGGMSAAAGSGGVGGSHRPAASPSSSSESWAGDRTNHSETWSDRPSPGTHPYPPPPPPPPPPLPLSRPSSFGASQRLATSPLPMNDALRHHSGSRTNSTSSGAGAASAQEKANRRPSVAARVLMDAVLLDAPEVQGMAMCDVDYMTNLTQGYQRPQTQPQLPPSGDHHAAQQHYAPQHALSHQNVHAHAALTPKGQRQQHYYR